MLGSGTMTNETHAKIMNLIEVDQAHDAVESGSVAAKEMPGGFPAWDEQETATSQNVQDILGLEGGNE